MSCVSITIPKTLQFHYEPLGVSETRNKMSPIILYNFFDYELIYIHKYKESIKLFD